MVLIKQNTSVDQIQSIPSSLQVTSARAFYLDFVGFKIFPLKSRTIFSFKKLDQKSLL